MSAPVLIVAGMGNLVSAVDELLAVDVAELSDATLAGELTELRTQIHRLEAAYLTRLEAFDRRGLAATSHGSTQGWLRAELRMAPGHASRDVHLARDLADALPVTRAALADGVISPRHAQVIARLRPVIGEAALAEAEPALVDAATRCCAQQLRAATAHLKHALAPERAHRDEQDDYRARRLHASTTIDGLGVGEWLLHPVGQEMVLTAIHAFSAPVPGDDRSPAQRRADALVTIADLALRSGQAPESGGVKPHATVIVDLATLEQRAGAPAADYGFGATSGSEWARRLLCDAGVARVITGARGEVLDAGRTMRTFSSAQRRAITARDRGCIWPGCTAPPSWCDAHHSIHWADGGATSIDNGVLVCGRHHDRIHLHRHAIIRAPDGRFSVDIRPNTAPPCRSPHGHGPPERGGP